MIKSAFILIRNVFLIYFLALLGTLQAATIVVPPGGSIQTAVNAAINGDTVQISAGTYVEEVIVVNKSINILGAGRGVTIIQAPGPATHLSNFFVFNGINYYCLLLIDNQALGTQTVNISELTIDGGTQQDTIVPPGYGDSNRLFGIGYHEANGMVTYTHITSFRQTSNFNELAGGGFVGASNNVPCTITMNSCIVDFFQRIGIDFRGLSMTGFVTNNIVNRGYANPPPPMSGLTTPNGIQFISALGYIIFNNVTGLQGNATNASGSGIIISGGASGMIVSGNIEDNNDVGIVTINTNLTKISNNTLNYTGPFNLVNPGIGILISNPAAPHEIYSNIMNNIQAENMELDSSTNQVFKLQNNQFIGSQTGLLINGNVTTGPQITMSHDTFTGTTSGYYIQEVDAPNNVWPSSATVSYNGLVPGTMTFAEFTTLSTTKILDQNTDPALGLVIAYIAPPPPTVPPTVTGVAPNSGVLSGGNSVTITGTGFISSNTTLNFGTQPAVITVVSDTQITAIAPPGTGTVNVTVTTPTGTSTISSANEYTYIAGAPNPPVITDLILNYGSELGANTITVKGTGFISGGTVVNFGAALGTAVNVIDNTTLTVVVPAGSGLVDVTATTTYGTSLTGVDSKYIYAILPPNVTSITPTSGSGSGGTFVTITGSGFLSANTTVAFGANPGTSVTVISDTTITVFSPAGAGTVDVTVTTPAGTSPIVPSDQFTYLPPVVTSISPNLGPTLGGTLVTIHGSGFNTINTTVAFGVTPATNVTVISDTEITAESPPGTGTVDVTVTTPAGTSAIVPSDQFTYLPLFVTSISPTSGPDTGGTLVTINGTGFLSASTSVAFGGIPATNVTIISDTMITAISPPGTGIVNVTVTTPAGTSPSVPGDLFTYISASTAPLPPSDFTGVITKNKFINVTSILLDMKWVASPSPDVVLYRIYNGTKLIGTIPATNPLIFVTDIKNKYAAFNFTIVAVNAANQESTPVAITIVHHHKHHHSHSHSHSSDD